MSEHAKKLWVLRHAKAEQSAITDEQRKLTAYGREQIKKLAEFFNRQQIIVDEVWVSPYLRAQQTADELFTYWSTHAPRKTTLLLEPDASPHSLIKEIQACELQSILLVSHQPLVNKLLAYLSVGEQQGSLVETMSTAALAQLTAMNWLPGWAQLDYVLQSD